MPGLAEERRCPRRRVLLLDHPLGLLGDLALDVLALAVEGVQLLRRFPREPGVLAQEKLDGKRGVGEAAGGVDPGPEPEGDVDRLDLCRA